MILYSHFKKVLTNLVYKNLRFKSSVIYTLKLFIKVLLLFCDVKEKVYHTYDILFYFIFAT